VQACSPWCARRLDFENLTDPETIHRGAHELVAALRDRAVELAGRAIVARACVLSTLQMPESLPVPAQEFGAFQHHRGDGLPDGSRSGEQREPVLITFTSEPDARGNALIYKFSIVQECRNSFE
jgi:hypothetical protein